MDLFENIVVNKASCPIIMIDNSYSTSDLMADGYTILDKEIETICTHLQNKDISDIYLMYWDSNSIFPADENAIKVTDIISYPVRPCGGTYIGQALLKIPKKWYEAKICKDDDVLDLYIVTDGEIFDGNDDTAKIFKTYIDIGFNVHILTVESNNRNYHSDNCNAGNAIYKLLNKQSLMKYVRKFISYNNIHSEGFVNFNNPNIPNGYVPFRDKCFKLDNTAKFIAYIDEMIVNDPAIDYLKLAHELTLPLHYLTIGKATCIQRGIINMFCSLFVKTDLYREVRGLFMTEIDNFALGKATTFQDYRNRREKVFEAAQLALYDNVKGSCMNAYRSCLIYSMRTFLQLLYVLVFTFFIIILFSFFFSFTFLFSFFLSRATPI